jgi:hypothetical protein
LATLQLTTAVAANAAPRPYLQHRWNNRYAVANVALAPDGQLIVASESAVVRGWDAPDHSTWEREIGDDFTSTNAMTMRADGGLVAAATDECDIHVMLDGLMAALDAGGEGAGAQVRRAFKRLIRETDVYLEAQKKARNTQTQ